MPLTQSFTILSAFVVFAIVGETIGILAWPALGRTLLAYGLAARIPVALLMLVAMLGNWGTHYDARPSLPQMSALGWWVGIGLSRARGPAYFETWTSRSVSSPSFSP